MRYRTIPMAALLGLVSLAAVAAAPRVSVDVLTEREVVDPASGELRRVPALDATPGDELIYTVRFTNDGDEEATGVVVDNPIPDGVVLVAGSPSGPGEVRFSIDGGRSYAAAERLTYDRTLPDGRRVATVATPEQYTHVRWTVDRLPADTRQEVGFRVRVR